jgi:hypothetical protein
MSWVYVLALVGGRYWVGCSEKVNADILQHSQGQKEEWTRKYPSLKTMCIFAGDEHDEELTVAALMIVVGDKLVRGASLAEMDWDLVHKDSEQHVQSFGRLPSEKQLHYLYQLLGDKDRAKRFIRRDISGCSRCLKEGHSSEKCRESRYFDGFEIWE